MLQRCGQTETAKDGKRTCHSCRLGPNPKCIRHVNRLPGTARAFRVIMFRLVYALPSIGLAACFWRGGGGRRGGTEGGGRGGGGRGVWSGGSGGGGQQLTVHYFI